MGQCLIERIFIEGRHAEFEMCVVGVSARRSGREHVGEHRACSFKRPVQAERHAFAEKCSFSKFSLALRKLIECGDRFGIFLLFDLRPPHRILYLLCTFIVRVAGQKVLVQFLCLCEAAQFVVRLTTEKHSFGSIFRIRRVTQPLDPHESVLVFAFLEKAGPFACVDA